MDCTHVTYLVKGLEKGLDVITEKPMCTNTEDCLKVLEAE
jgi:predicted dehydrogenase